MKKIQEQKDGSGKPFLSKIQNGVYQIIPLIMMKGSENKKQLLLNYYDDSKSE